MSLESQITALAVTIGNHTRDNVLPRLIPNNGVSGQIVSKVGSGQYETEFIDTPSQRIGGKDVFDGGNF